MKAIQIQAYGGPEVIDVVDIPVPGPGPGQVLVKAHSLGVGYPDVLLRTGVYKWKPALPSILGNEMSGHIEALGDGVTGLEVGPSWCSAPAAVDMPSIMPSTRPS